MPPPSLQPGARFADAFSVLRARSTPEAGLYDAREIATGELRTLALYEPRDPLGAGARAGFGAVVALGFYLQRQRAGRSRLPAAPARPAEPA